MLNKNIAKISAFVTIICGFCLILTACGLVFSNSPKSSGQKSEFDFSDNYGKPKVIGTIKSDEITESSGLIVSRCNREVFWTHNDSGDGPFIFALNPKGEKLATYHLPNAKNIDWEDIATIKTNGECFIYVGDIGNNTSPRSQFTIYRVKEPTVSGATDSSEKNPLETEPAEAIKFEYPDTRHDAETLMVHPQTSDIYILTKQLTKPCGVYKLAKSSISDGVNKLVKITDYTVPAVPNGFLTGGEISPDGKHVVLCDYLAGYEINLPDNANNFDNIWKQKAVKFDLGEREQGESICYSLDGKTIYAGSEKRNSPLIEVKRK